MREKTENRHIKKRKIKKTKIEESGEKNEVRLKNEGRIIEMKKGGEAYINKAITEKYKEKQKTRLPNSTLDR